MRGIEQIPWLYDLLMRLAPGIERWRSKLVAGARGRVLEVGCGTGRGLPDYGGGVELFASLHGPAGRLSGPGLRLWPS